LGQDFLNNAGHADLHWKSKGNAVVNLEG